MSETPHEQKKFEISPSVAILISGALIAGAVVFTNLQPAVPLAGAEDLPVEANVPLPSEADHYFGSLSAPIALIEYSDFECPYCRVVYPTLKRIVEESDGQIVWVHRNLPLESIHPQALPAAMAAECIAAQLGNDGFWKFVEAVFADQSKMSTAFYTEIAGQLGADVAAYASCVSANTYADKIAKEASDAGASGGRGTPFTVVAGAGVQVPVSGALPYEQFMSVIKALQERL